MHLNYIKYKIPIHTLGNELTDELLIFFLRSLADIPVFSALLILFGSFEKTGNRTLA